jgi:hypothetical protein
MQTLADLLAMPGVANIEFEVALCQDLSRSVDFGVASAGHEQGGRVRKNSRGEMQ